jgi:hypothetical protein
VHPFWNRNHKIIKRLFVFSKSKSELLCDWRFTVNQFVLTSPLRLTTSNFIFKLDPSGYSPYVTSSMTRGWVCRLQLLLVLASAVTLRSESGGTHDILPGYFKTLNSFNIRCRRTNKMEIYQFVILTGIIQ